MVLLCLLLLFVSFCVLSPFLFCLFVICQSTFSSLFYCSILFFTSFFVVFLIFFLPYHYYLFLLCFQASCLWLFVYGVFCRTHQSILGQCYFFCFFYNLSILSFIFSIFLSLNFFHFISLFIKLICVINYFYYLESLKI